MQALRPSEVCPQPLSVSSRLLGSMRVAARAPAYGVAGSCRLPITSTGVGGAVGERPGIPVCVPGRPGGARLAHRGPVRAEVRALLVLFGPSPPAIKQGSRMAGGVTSTKREPPVVALDGD